jgi:hypothetical protein
VAYATDKGGFRLTASGRGRWVVEVEQQVDTPDVQPVPGAVTLPSTMLIATGRFGGVDRQGSGRVDIYRLRDGRELLRLDDFYVTPNTDLELRLTHLQADITTKRALDAAFARVAFLEATAGSMNFTLPPGVRAEGFRSVVVWCQITLNAYAAAVLQPPGSGA